MRKILVLLLVFGLVIGCVGVVSASMTIFGSESPKVNDTITYSVSAVTNATTYTGVLTPPPFRRQHRIPEQVFPISLPNNEHIVSLKSFNGST